MAERSLQYRPYLDGLRGIAVLLVFVFHAARPGLPGGFIGVDIFFVLSGYLITRILLTQHEKSGQIRIADFYARRVRRLMPAVLLVVLVVVLREALWGDVLETAARLRDSIATLFYVENWNLVSQADQYFGESLTPSPLRHAWSLSIEEQFYLLWPLILVAVLALARGRMWRAATMVTGLALASAVAMAILFEPGLPTRAYYGTDARVQQPLIGAVLAFLMLRTTHSRAPHRQRSWNWPVTAVILLGALALAARLFTGETEAYYRGGSTLIALITAALIYSLEMSPKDWASRTLGWNPLRQLGQISYGFYLWHWPIILWLAVPEGFGFWERRLVNLAQFGLTVAIALASFVILENPIRERVTRVGRLGSVATVAIGVGMLALVGGVAYAVLAPRGPVVAAVGETGTPTLSGEDPVASPANENDANGSSTADFTALIETALADRSFEPCPSDPMPCVKVEGSEPDSPTVVLIGDSTAQSYDPALKVLAKRYGFRYVQAAVGGCPISHRLLATGTDGALHKASNFKCFEAIPDIYAAVVDEYRPALIIATSWNEKNQHVERDVLLISGTPEHLAATESALRDATDLLTSGGAHLAFLDILPPGMAVDCLERGGPESEGCTRAVEAESGETPYNKLFHQLANESDSVVSLRLTDIVCPDGSCPLMMDNVVVRYDGNHFTATGSRMMAPVIDSRLREAGIDLSTLSAADSS